MIKLMDLLLEVKLSPKEQEQYKQALALLQDETLDEGIKDSLKKLGLSAAVITALMASPQLSQAQKSVVGDLKAQTTSTTQQTRQGTSVDGIIGEFTSQFKFPVAFNLDLDSKKMTNLGVEGNDALTFIRGTGIDKPKMDEWNKFVDWMKSKGYSGKTDMNHKEYSDDVLDQYKKIKPNFWVKDTNDIKTVQKIIKNYRIYTMAQWKAGDKDSIITLGGRDMDPNNPEDIKAVKDRYMRWAKD